jgi:hypothetical protein
MRAIPSNPAGAAIPAKRNQEPDEVFGLPIYRMPALDSMLVAPILKAELASPLYLK